MTLPINLDPNFSGGVAGAGRVAPRPTAPAAGKAEGPSFQDVLKNQIGESSEIRFSSHALARLRARGIEIRPDLMKKIENAVAKAASKGARDSLLVTDNLALIVSVKNRTVITALDGSSMRENVFTNIDSAVFV